MRTHNICYCGEIKKNQQFFVEKSTLSGTMIIYAIFAVCLCFKPSFMTQILSTYIDMGKRLVTLTIFDIKPPLFFTSTKVSLFACKLPLFYQTV